MNRLNAEMSRILERAEKRAGAARAELFIPEHVFIEMIKEDIFKNNFESLGGDMDILEAELSEIFDEIDTGSRLEISEEIKLVFTIATMDSVARHLTEVPFSSFLIALIKNPNSDIRDMIESQGVDIEDLLDKVIEEERANEYETSTVGTGSSKKNSKWKSLVKDFMKIADERKEPLVGRESEIEDTIRILCRKEKSNPLHLGEPGVGKTAITLGLAKRINEGNVPEKLKNKKIYSLEVGSLMSGTKFRGELEEKVKTILEGAEAEGDVILYIDEIHTIVGAGAGSDNSLDIGNLLKQLLMKNIVSIFRKIKHLIEDLRLLMLLNLLLVRP